MSSQSPSCPAKYIYEAYIAYLNQVNVGAVYELVSNNFSSSELTWS